MGRWNIRVRCGAFLALFAFCGCRHVAEPVAEAPASAEETPQADVAPLEDVPDEGYDWDVLARMAAADDPEAKALLIGAAVERWQAAVDTQWRNPQLRAGQSWGDADDETVRSTTGARTGWGGRETDTYTAGVRMYTANPFVNRWLRRRGSAAAAAGEAEAGEAAYAVFCEVRALCLEAELLREETALLEQVSAVREQALGIRREQAEAGVANETELIRAEARQVSARAAIGERQVARQRLMRQIAVLTGVPDERLRLRPRGQARLPEVAGLDEAALTELAFLRRPDLLRARREREVATCEVGAARTGQIPWFEYVEGSWENEETRGTSFSQGVVGHERSARDEDEWQVRVAMTLPVFSWLGDEVRLSRARLSAAEVRLQGMYGRIRREVGGLLADYRSARAACEGVIAERDRLGAAMARRIEALAEEPSVRREDVLEAREELIRYMQVCLKTEQACLRLAQELEAASGGPLGEAANGGR